MSNKIAPLPGHESEGAKAGAWFISGGGEAGARIRAIDWRQSRLGAASEWPQSLRTALSICLNSRFPIALYWGPEFVMLYNDSLLPMVGANKHPHAMGLPAFEVLPEIRTIIEPLLVHVTTTGEATWSEDLMLPLVRGAAPEESYFTFTYSPIHDEAGAVGGVFCAVIETTDKVIEGRRLRLLKELAAATQERTQESACTHAALCIARYPEDVPFALLYLLDEGAGIATLAGAANIEPGTARAPRSVAPGATAPWPLHEEHAGPRFVDTETGVAGARGAVILPIERSGGGRPLGFIVAGLSPLLGKTASYERFHGLLASSVAQAVGNAAAYEEERRRAEVLAELDRAKTIFFSNISHEFRTPLTLMLGPAEDALSDSEHPLPAVQRERLELLRRNGLRLQKLVNTLLDFSRIEAGRARASFVPTDLSALTRDLVSSFDTAMASAGLQYAVDLPDLPEPVYVDPSLWEKVILNLLSNALKFTFEGSVKVALRWLGEHVELRVADTGTGIPEKELPRVFERFYRVEGARGRSHEGSGIGLALVKELVKLHGGTVEMASTLGKGSEVTVRLPAGFEHLPKAHLVARTLEPAGIAPASFLAEVAQWNDTSTGAAPNPARELQQPRARIIVADDNADMRAYLSRLLSPHWTVEAFSNGAQALAAAQANPPQLILSDVMMPELDGLALVRALRSDERTRTTQVLLLSARAGQEAVIDGLESGADGYLVKPFTADELLARVSSTLAVAKLRGEALQAERAHSEEVSRLLGIAERATRSREQTLAIVSHDLRTPLSTIGSAAELIYDSVRGEAHAARLNRPIEAIRRSVAGMTRLLNDLLDAASLDAGGLSLDPAEHPVEQLVGELRESFESHAAKRKIALQTRVAAGLSRVWCDKQRVLQTLSNLVSNAVKFTAAGGTVWVTADVEQDDVRFSVTDTGRGIPPEAHRHVFDRYWHETQERREGHGLGLFIAKGIVEKHGGRIELTRSDASGTTFSFWLPVAQHEPVNAGAPLQLERAAASHADATPSPMLRFIQGGGEMGALMRSIDWSKSSLGALETWPQSLRTSVSTMLRSPYPIILFWGPERRMLYNDPFRPILGAKHPATMGARGSDALVEEWTLLGPLMARAHETGQPIYVQNGNVNFARRPGGLREEAYFTWSYNPTIGEQGEIAGLFAIASETTRQVVGDRRLGILRELSIRTALDKRAEQVFESLTHVLTQAGHDTPFALLYALEGGKARLVSCAGLSPGTPAAPKLLGIDDASPWPLAAVARSGNELLVEDLTSKLGPLPGGPWPEPAVRALVLPVPMGSEADTSGVLVVGLSPLSSLDDEYRGFLQLLARQLSASISSARAYEDERRRAEELAELDRAKTAFFSNVSHEFRTPLTLILGPVEDALAHADKALAGDKLDVVRRNAVRLFKMVNTLLDFSRMEAGRAQATFVPTDLAAFTASLASQFSSAVDSANLAFSIECAPLPEPIYVDPDMWEKIVLNLLSNAVKYTHVGHIRVTWAGRMHKPCSPSRTRASAFPAKSCLACSSASIASTPRTGARTKAPASGWRSWTS